MEKIKISQAAKMLGVSLNSVYRKVKLCETKLNGQVIKENGVTFITTEGLESLKGLFSRLNPGETQDSKGIAGDSHLQEIIANQQRTIDALIAKQAEERQRTDSIIMKLAHDLEDTRRSALAIEMKVNALLPKPNEIDQAILNQPPKPVAVWTPPARKDPLESAGVLEKVWAYFMEPERMRSQCAP